MNYKQAMEIIQKMFIDAGWKSSGRLKTPWLDNGEIRLYFKPRAIYAGPSGCSIGDTRSITVFWYDPKDLALFRQKDAIVARAYHIAGVNQ